MTYEGTTAMTYQPLRQFIEPYCKKLLTELSDDVRERIAAMYWIGWDWLTPEQRLAFADQYDAQHDPANSEENKRSWQLVCALQEAKQQIATWEMMPAQSITEMTDKERKLAELRAQQTEIQKQLMGEMETLDRGSTGNAPQARHRWQEDQILQAIIELGYTPTKLPTSPRGKRGVKAAVCAKLTTSHWQGTVFVKAWARLRNDGRIADASDSPTLPRRDMGEACGRQ